MTRKATNDDTTKAAAQYLLRHGLATVAEIAKLSGRSNQIVRVWALEYPDARAERLAKIWSRAVFRTTKNVARK
jgi:hypothetical protein